MKRTTTLMTLAIALLIAITPGRAQTEVKTVELKGMDDLTFTVTEIKANPGQEIRVELTTVSDYPKAAMAHNVVLLRANADATAVANASARASDNEYIAPGMTDQIIAYTGLAGDGETVSVTFTAPDKPGEYPFICTFPGHYSGGMKGSLIVE